MSKLWKPSTYAAALALVGALLATVIVQAQDDGTLSDALRGIFGNAVDGIPPAADDPLLVAPAPGVVNCAILSYGVDHRTHRCFSSEFLAVADSETNIRCNPKFVLVQLEADELYQHPFAVMSGEGHFQLTSDQQRNLRTYLENGGFVLASAGCSSPEWQASFRAALEEVFPQTPLQRLDFSHPVFHTVFDIQELRCKGRREAHLEGLELNGKVVLIFSPDGLNDTSKAGSNCCCCGGSEILNARQMNVNLLAYTLTH
jgi:hypothetical protein